MEQGINYGVSSKRQVMAVKFSVINHCKVFSLNILLLLYTEGGSAPI